MPSVKTLFIWLLNIMCTTFSVFVTSIWYTKLKHSLKKDIINRISSNRIRSLSMKEKVLIFGIGIVNV